MKIKDLQKDLAKKKIDFALFLNSGLSKMDPNMNYFSHVGIEFGALVVPKKKCPFLVVPCFEKDRIKKISAIKTVVAIARKRDLYSTIKSKLRNIKKIGLNKNIFSLNDFVSLRRCFKNTRFADISRICSNLRKTKTWAEIKSIKKACAATDKIMGDAINKFHKFRTEQEVKEFLETQAIKQGFEPSFPAIVASGSNAATPHYTPRNIKLKGGFCVIDFGLRYNGYCSDITRTVYIGRPSKTDINSYNKVLDVQEKAIAMAENGKLCSDICDMAKKALGRYFIHGLGHGIGVEVHERPNLNPESREKIEDGMVFTIEPGIYPVKYGIRIEDDVLIDNGHAVLLTKTPKDLKTIRRY